MTTTFLKDSSPMSQLKNDLFLGIIFIVVSSAIILKSYFQVDGYLSPDSTGYLHLAKRMLDGQGFTDVIYNDHLFQNRHAAVWPFGYPLAIAIIAWIFNSSVFWASKAVNILVVGMILLILRFLFKNRAFMIAPILLSASFIEQFSYSLTEVPFILGMVLLAASLVSFFKMPNRLWLPSLLVFVSGMIMFLSRYAGSFFLAILVVLFIYSLIKKDYIRTLYLTATGLISFLVISNYLYYNYLITGYTSGMARIPSKESHFDLLISLITAVLNEINVLRHSFDGYGLLFLFLFTQLLLLSIPVIKYFNTLELKKTIRAIKLTDLPLIFCFVGFSYWASIIYIRWKYHFDPFSFRLLGPGTLLIIIAFISLTDQTPSKKFKSLWFKIIGVLALASFLLNVPLKTYTQHNIAQLTYQEKITKIEAALKSIKKNDIVFTWNRDVKYLRADLLVMSPNPYMNNLKSDKLSEFSKQIISKYPKKSIYYFDEQNLLTNKKINSVTTKEIYRQDGKVLYQLLLK